LLLFFFDHAALFAGINHGLDFFFGDEGQLAQGQRTRHRRAAEQRQRHHRREHPLQRGHQRRENDGPLLGGAQHIALGQQLAYRYHQQRRQQHERQQSQRAGLGRQAGPAGNDASQRRLELNGNQPGGQKAQR